MQPFEWVNARSAAEAANSGATTVAAAMVVRVGGRATQDAVVIKAGGLDLLDLMKEGLLQPRRIVNLRGIAGLDRIVEEEDGTLRIGALVTIAQVASNPIILSALYGLGRRHAQFGEPADPQRGDARRQPAAATALLVLPFGAARLRPQRRRELLCIRR